MTFENLYFTEIIYSDFSSESEDSSDFFSSRALTESFILPLSKPISLTVTSSPSEYTAETLSVLSWEISDICNKPSLPGRIFTKAPKSTIFTTFPL